jgi:hypothetical protein
MAPEPAQTRLAISRGGWCAVVSFLTSSANKVLPFSPILIGFLWAVQQQMTVKVFVKMLLTVEQIYLCLDIVSLFMYHICF